MISLFIFLSFWLGLSLSYAYLALGIVALAFLFFLFKRFNYRLSLIALAFILAGFAFSFAKTFFLNHRTSVHEGIVYAAKDNYFLINSGGERLYVYAKNHAYDIGDYLSIEGEREELSFTTLESSFDFKDYLNKRGVYHALSVKRVTVKFHNFIRINQRRKKLLKQFNNEERSIIGAMLFSEREESETSNTLTSLHLARFLSASGIFIGVFNLVLVFFFKLFLQDKYAELISLSILSVYGLFTFPRFSVIKVLLFLLIKWINKYPLKKKFSYLNLISGLGLFFLIINPYLAAQESFILGFSIPIISYLGRYVGYGNKIRNYFYRFIMIYLFFIPFEAAFYHKIVAFSLPLQIISGPVLYVIAFISLLCFFYIPLYKLDKFFIYLLKNYASFIKPLSFGLLLPNFHELIYIIYYSLYTLYIYNLSRRHIPLYRFYLISQLSLVTLYSLPIHNLVSEEVNFINVGQGDCTLVRSHNKTVLIDTGGLSYLDVAKESLIPYLQKKRIYKIDAVFITHYDYDHYGALSSLRTIYEPDYIYDYHSTYPVDVGNLTFNNYNYDIADYTEENDKSLVLSFYTCKKHFVIMGDAPSKVEKKILKREESVPCDVLKVGHHGSNTSTSEAWIDYLKPNEAVISCGVNNRYGHPNQEVLNILNKYHVKIHRTDLEGTITYQSIFI